LVIASPKNQHVVVQIRANGDEDSFSIVSNLSGSSNDPNTPDANLFRVQRNGNAFIGVNDEVTYIQSSKTLNITSGTTLNVGGSWSIGGVVVTATASHPD
jgi:hypothetical protein